MLRLFSVVDRWSLCDLLQLVEQRVNEQNSEVLTCLLTDALQSADDQSLSEHNVLIQNELAECVSQQFITEGYTLFIVVRNQKMLDHLKVVLDVMSGKILLEVTRGIYETF